jgi:peptidylprolyl isomerase
VNRLLACCLLFALAACGGDDTLTGPSEITTEEITVGTGATAAAGDIVTVHYILFLENGTRLQSSYTDLGAPITIQIGAGQVIPGFERGIVGMRVGGKRRVTIPPSLAYGSTGSGPVPPNATIRFEIELVSIAGK